MNKTELSVEDLIDLCMDLATYGSCIIEITESERRYFDIMKAYDRGLSDVYTEKVPVDMLVNYTLDEILETVNEKRS